MVATNSERTVELEAEIAESFDTVPVDAEEWDDFVLSVGGDIYMTFDWCRIWWRYYGEDRALRLFIFRANGRVVGLAPMFIERVRLGPVSLKLGKRVGADYAMAIFSLPIAADHVESVYSHVISKLIGAERCDAVWIGFCPGDDPTLAGLLVASDATVGLVSGAHVAATGVRTVFDLPGTFDAYLKRLDARQRQNYRRRLKLLNSAYEVENELVSDPSQAESSFADFVLAHERQWKAEGKLGHFGDRPRAAEFNTELVRILSKSRRVRLLVLKADGTVISYQFAFVFGRRCYWHLPARTAKV